MTHRSRVLSLSLLTLVAGATSFACSASSQDPQAGDENAIIGGAEALTKKLAAVGAIVPGYWTGGVECDSFEGGAGFIDGGAVDGGAFEGGGGSWEGGPGPSCRYVTRWAQGSPVCTGTLVGPRTVLTSRRCMSSIAGSALAFNVGPNAWSPVETRRIVDTSWTNSRFHPESGLDGDVAVLTLDAPVQNAEPLPLLPSSQVGPILSSFAQAGASGAAAYIVGFGPDETGYAGVRRLGQVTPDSRIAMPFQHAYDGDFATFQREWPASSYDAGSWSETGPNSGPYSADNLEALWETKLSERETYVASSTDTAQPRVCGADKGGPLLVARNGALAVAGVFTIALDPTSRCEHGAVFATVGADIEEVVATESKCAEIRAYFGNGQCEGTVATSCVTTRNGKRITRTDCAPLGLECRSGVQSAACVDPSEADAGAP